MAENAGGAAAVVDNSPSLVSWTAEQFGDFSTVEPESDAGAPPAEIPEPPADSEGTAASEPAGAPPAEAEPDTEPDPGTPTSVADDDPFEGSTPLAYTVNGESRAYEGITVLKDGRAIIDDPAKVKDLERRLGERDHLYEKDRARHEQFSTLERATAWRTKDANGHEQTITGVQAAQEWRLHAAQMAARTVTYERAFDAMIADPQHFTKLYSIVTDEQGQYGPTGQQYVVPNRAGFEDMKREAATFARETALAMREQFPKVIAAPPPPETPVSDLAVPTIESIVTANNITGLSAEDKTFLAGQFERYVMTTDKGRMVDPRFVDLIKRTAQTASTAAASVAAVTAVVPRNQARLAAATVGRKPVAKPVTRRPEPEDEQETDFDRAFFNRQKAAAGALRAHNVGA